MRSLKISHEIIRLLYLTQVILVLHPKSVTCTKFRRDCKDCENLILSQEDYSLDTSLEYILKSSEEKIENRIGESLNAEIGPENKQMVAAGGQTLLDVLIERLRRGFLNIRNKILSYSDVGVILILSTITVAAVLAAVVLSFILGPLFTACFALLFPFAVIGLIGIPLLVAKPLAPAQAVVMGPEKMAVIGRLRERACDKRTKRYFNVTTLIFFSVVAVAIWDIPRALATEREKFSLKIKSRYSPNNTETESYRSPRGLTTVTKSFSQKPRSRSTVSHKWPSHKFLRFQLSRNDNIKTKKNGSKSTRKRQPYGTIPPSSLYNSNNNNSTEKSKQEIQNYLNTTNRTNDKGNMRPLSYYHELGITGSNSTEAKSVINKSEGTVDKQFKETRLSQGPPHYINQNEDARSVTFKDKSVEKVSDKASLRTGTQRRSSHSLIMPGLDENFGKQTNTKDRSRQSTLDEKESGGGDVGENTTLSTLTESTKNNWNANATHESSPNHEYSQYHTPKVGFQYEIVVPYKTNSSGSGFNKTTSISTTSTVIMDNGGKQVTDDATTPTTFTSPPPLSPGGVDMQESIASLGISTTTKVPQLHQNFLFNKNGEVISQNPQYPTPTHKAQLNAYLSKMNESSSSSSSSNNYNGKDSFGSAIPSNQKRKGDKAHEEIRRKGLSTINHNFGTVQRTKTTSPSPLNFSHTYRPNFKDNSNYVNTYLQATLTTHSTPTNSWKAHPTQISFIQPVLSSSSSQMQKGKGDPISFQGETLNQASHNKVRNTKLRIYKDQVKYYEHTNGGGSSNNNVLGNKTTIQKKSGRPLGENQTTLIHRKNMFTVVNRAETNPKIRVEAKGTNSKLNNKITNIAGAQPLPANNLYDRTNQLEKPIVMTSILTGPDRTASNALEKVNEGKYSDYFDEDDGHLHHWIESEQGHSVSYSTELPKFTNLTWPYYITSSETNNKGGSNGVGGEGFAGGGLSKSGIMSPASTGISVSFQNTRGKEKIQDFDSNYEFYIPSAQASPFQKPILVAKKDNNATTLSPTKPSVMQNSNVKFHPSLDLQAGNHEEVISSMNHVKQNHKGVIKQSHWGSKGQLPIWPPKKSENVKLPIDSQVSLNNIQVYESSTGNPKSSSSFPSTYPRQSPAKNSYSTFATSTSTRRPKPFRTSSSSSSTTTAVFGGQGQTEIAGFITAKPANIYYKPIINHFTSVPYNESTLLLNKVMNGEVISLNASEAQEDTSNSFGWSTKQPPTTKRKGYVGESDDVDTSSTSNSYKNSHNSNKNLNIFHGGGGGVIDSSTITTLSGHKDSIKGPILFKVWNVVDGKLKLEKESEIPAWALNGYLLPQSGTILNLQQIPPALQPFVTNAIKKEAEVVDDTLSYVWQKLPIFGESYTKPESETSKMGLSTTPSYFTENTYQRYTSTTKLPPTTTTSAATTTSVTTTITAEPPAESPFEESNENEFTKISSYGNAGIGWSEHKDKEVMESKRPISINYVLWNTPASIYGQSIILSTPTPQLLLSPQPTPVSYFPSSPITPLEDTIRPSTMPFSTSPKPIVTIKHPSSGHTTILPESSSINQDKLELLFQKYFQYFITTPETPAATSMTRLPTTLSPIKDGNGQVYGFGTTSSANNNAWDELKKMILRLAATKSKNANEKDSLALEKEKVGDLEFLRNVASIAVIMSYLRNQHETALLSQKNQSISQNNAPLLTTTTTTSEPYGVTDDMTPPHKDQLWATVYPLFQHYLNNPNFTFIPPNRAPSTPADPPFSEFSITSGTSTGYSMTPTSPPEPILFTEPVTGGTTGSSDYYTRYNHYVSYSTTGLKSSTARPSSEISITQIPRHGATTPQYQRSEGSLDNDNDDNSAVDIQAEKLKTLLLIKKLKKKKKKLDRKKKKDKLVPALLGAALLKKVSKPLLHVVKKPSKYWLDLKFDIDFYDIIKKKLLYFIAYRYMPVALVLAFGLIPLALSMVPLLYKIWWLKLKKPKYIKVPVPFPKPYPVPVFKPPPPPPPYHYYNDHHQHPNIHGHSPPEEHFHDNHEQDIIHIDSNTPQQRPLVVDHHYAADSTGRDPNENSHEENYAFKKASYLMPPRESGGGPGEAVNSFNYDYVKHSTPTHDGQPYKYPYVYNHHQNRNQDQDQEIHVHLHDEEESIHHPTALLNTDSPPPLHYTSYHKKDLQPYPASRPWEMGYDIGQTISDMTNKQDMEILKILIENKKEKINKLLDMWKLAKYGVKMASNTASNVASNVAHTVMGGLMSATTPVYNEAYVKRKRKRKRKRRKIRNKRKHSVESSHAIQHDYENSSTTKSM